MRVHWHAALREINMYGYDVNANRPRSLPIPRSVGIFLLFQKEIQYSARAIFYIISVAPEVEEQGRL